MEEKKTHLRWNPMGEVASPQSIFESSALVGVGTTKHVKIDLSSMID
jgi:hypothetical protein